MPLRRLITVVKETVVKSALYQRVLTLHRAHVAYRATMVAHRRALTTTGDLLRQQNEVYSRLLVLLKSRPLDQGAPEVVDLQAEIVVLEAELELAREAERAAKDEVGAASRRIDELAPARRSRPW